MADILTKPMLANWALAELGLAPKFSIDAEASLGGDFDIFWPRTVARCFGLHDWTFCRKTYRLTRESAQPDTGYRYGFVLPQPRLGEPVKLLRDPRNETPIRDFRIEGDQLSCDDADVWAVCKVERDPASWDPQFADCFAVAFAANLAVPLLQDLDIAADKEARAFGPPSQGGAGGMFGRLIAQNRAAHPVGSPFLREDPLTSARW